MSVSVDGVTVKLPAAVRFTPTSPVNPLIALASKVKVCVVPAVMSKVVGVAVRVKFGRLTTFRMNCEVCVMPFQVEVTVTGV